MQGNFEIQRHKAMHNKKAHTNLITFFEIGNWEA